MAELIPDSILQNIKKRIGLEADYSVFDVDILMHINSAFARLNQLGVGPEETVEITSDEDRWSLFLNGDVNLNPAKDFVFLYVKSRFDLDATSYLITARANQLKELEWTLNVYSEGLKT